MTIPSRPQIVPELLRLLAEYPTGVEPKAIYTELAERMGVGRSSLRETYDDGRLRWHISVQAARETLAQQGLLVRELRGQWKLTPRGIATAGRVGSPPRRVVLVRVGWMEGYGAPGLPEGEIPKGGGAFNQENVGGEVTNFCIHEDGSLYGYVQTPGSQYGFNLSKIAPTADGPSVDDVLVVFFARYPTGGQRVVGWYWHATCFEEHRVKGDRWANVVAKAEHAVLLPVDHRLRGPVLPRGPGTPGQSNVFYLIGSDGERRDSEWLSEVLGFVSNYSGPNLLDPTDASAVLQAGSGQGFLSSAAARRAVENRAMEMAKEYFEARDWPVTDVSASSSCDLHAHRDDENLYIEVKGTTQTGDQVFMTANEIDLLRRKSPDTAVYVLHGVLLEGDDELGWVASGGDEAVYWPFDPRDHDCAPITFRVGFRGGE